MITRVPETDFTVPPESSDNNFFLGFNQGFMNETFIAASGGVIKFGVILLTRGVVTEKPL